MFSFTFNTVTKSQLVSWARRAGALYRACSAHDLCPLKTEKTGWPASRDLSCSSRVLNKWAGRLLINATETLRGNKVRAEPARLTVLHGQSHINTSLLLHFLINKFCFKLATEFIFNIVIPRMHIKNCKQYFIKERFYKNIGHCE